MAKIRKIKRYERDRECVCVYVCERERDKAKRKKNRDTGRDYQTDIQNTKKH